MSSPFLPLGVIVAPATAEVVIADVPCVVTTRKWAAQHASFLREGSLVLAELELATESAETQVHWVPLRHWTTASNKMKPGCCVQFAHKLLLESSNGTRTKFRMRKLVPLALHRMSSIHFVRVYFPTGVDTKLLPSCEAIAHALRHQVIFHGVRVSILLKDSSVVIAQCHTQFARNATRLQLKRSSASTSPQATDVAAWVGVVSAQCTVHVVVEPNKWTNLSFRVPNGCLSRLVDGISLFRSQCSTPLNSAIVDRHPADALPRELFDGSHTTMLRSLLVATLHGKLPGENKVSPIAISLTKSACSVLVRGAAGAGKKTLVTHVLQDVMDSHFSVAVFSPTLAEMMGVHEAEVDEPSSCCFRQAIRVALAAKPAVVVLDYLDQVFPRSDNPSVRRAIAMRVHRLKRAMIKLNQHSQESPFGLPDLRHDGGVVIIGICANIRDVDSAALRLFDFSIPVTPPSIQRQCRILHHHLRSFRVHSEVFSDATRTDSFVRQFCAAYSPLDIATVVRTTCSQLSASPTTPEEPSSAQRTQTGDSIAMSRSSFWAALENVARSYIPREVGFYVRIESCVIENRLQWGF